MGWIEKVSIPPGRIGDAQIDHFEVPEGMTLEKVRLGARCPDPGRYTRLRVAGVLMMTDTMAEMFDHYDAVRNAKGDVLITGLGLGMVANAVARRDVVNSVTVVEISNDVISLVKDSLDPKVRVELGDAFTWTPPKSVKYNMIWHDIWPDICVDNLADITRLKRRFARRLDGWQGAWVEGLLRAQKRRDDRSGGRLW